MTPERLQQIRQVFAEAIQLPASERSAFVARSCGADRDLQAEVESLLSQSDSSESDVAGLRIAHSQHATITTPLRERPLHRPPGAATFQPDQLLAERYRIVRFIGQGGMGEVYEAEDLELRERVALKTILPEIAADDLSLDRFKREIHLARKVTHPNVSRIFDLQYHHPPGSKEGSREGSTIFLTMELLNGETLAQRLRRTGRIAPAEAFSLVEQMAAGLTAAHKAGIIHRDFKSANVILVPDQDFEGGARAVVTDFGLARRSAAGDVSIVLSHAGEVVGTPAYMAPEQVRGEALTPAADVYAFGIVLYELITGKLPFTGETPIAIAIQRLERSPSSPRTHIPDLDSKWETAILRCLERNPADRFPTALDAVKVIAGDVVPAPVSVARPRFTVRFRYLTAVVASLLVLAAVIGYRAYFARTAPGSKAALARSVAVFDFKNTSGQEAESWLSEYLARAVADDLAGGNQLLVIPTRDVLSAAKELHLSDSETMDAGSLAQVKRRLNADYVVSGSYLALGKKSGGQIRVEVRLLDATSGKMLATVQNTGAENDIFNLLRRPTDRLRQELGVPPVTTSEGVDVIASIPANPDAARPYSEGLKKLNSFDVMGAIPLLQKAIAADPKHPMIHAYLAEAWSELGYDAKAREEAQKAFDLSTNLSPEKRSLIEGRYREMTYEWDKAVDIYRTLWIRFPEQQEFGFRLAAAQTSAGKAKEALSTLEGLRKLETHDNPNPRIDIERAEAFDSLADYRAQRDAASAAAAVARKIGAKLVLAHARVMECWASVNLGEAKEGMSACEEAKQINEALGNRAGTARAVSNIASAFAAQGDMDGAKRMHGEALAIAREIGDKADMQGAMNNFANILFAKGQYAEAKQFYDQGLALAQERGNKAEIANLLNNIAGVYQTQGNLSGAEREYEQALVTAREVGNQTIVARVVYNLGLVMAKRGDLGGALNHYQESLAIRQKLGLKSEVAQVQVSIGDILLAQGDLTGAAKSCRDALATQNALGEKDNMIYTQLSLAAISFEQGDFAAAENTFRRAAADFQEQKDQDDEAVARAGLASALLSQKKTAEAQKEIQQAAELGKNSTDVTVRLTVSIASARQDAAMGKYPEATKTLEAALSEASKLGLVGFQLETRLARGELAMMSGQSSGGRAILDGLKQEASPRGFALIARKAGLAAAGKP